MEFSYDEANMFTFIRKIDMNEQIDGFVRLKHDFYIFLALNDSSSDKLFIKKYQNGKVSPLKALLIKTIFLDINRLIQFYIALLKFETNFKKNFNLNKAGIVE